MLGVMAATAFLSTLPLAQVVPQVPVSRAGNTWVAVKTSSFPAPPQGRLQISARAHIVVRGGDSSNAISYKLTQRVPVTPAIRSEEAARQFIGAPAVYRSPDGTSVGKLVLSPGASSIVASELEVTVPKQLVSVVVEAPSGSVEAYDLEGAVQITTGAGEIRAEIGRAHV